MILILDTSFTRHSEERSDEESRFDGSAQAHRSERISRRGTIHRDRLVPDLPRDSQILRVCESDRRNGAFDRPAVEESRLARACQAQLS
jgi:hypothetical protein